MLIHGANGSGKTSILAAVEFALIGEVRSMRRYDNQYLKHLPHHGSSSATIRIELADKYAGLDPLHQVTIDSAGVKGESALDPRQAQFYSERSYLDQESLGKLLDLYQYTEGSQESALVRFVNELLGLDQLNALKSGLHDATDIRRVRKLSSPYSDAEREAADADKKLTITNNELADTETELAESHKQLQEALNALGFKADVQGREVNLDEISLILANGHQDQAIAETERLQAALIELRGRIRVLGSLPVAQRINEARAAAVSAVAAIDEWRSSYEAPVTALQNDVASLGIEADGGLAQPLTTETATLEHRLAKHESACTRTGIVTQNVNNLQCQLEAINVHISKTETRTGSLASGLLALRKQVTGDLCPVCNRDFSEVSTISLPDHISRKINDLADEGVKLQTMIQQRTELEKQIQAAQREVSDLETVILTDSKFKAATAKLEAVTTLNERLNELSEAIERGVELRKAVDDTAATLADMQVREQEQQNVASELAAHAATLGEPAPTMDESPEEVWERLNKAVTKRLRDLNQRNQSLSDTTALVNRLRDITSRHKKLTAKVAELKRCKHTWAQRVQEADRRREIARMVHKTASTTRTAIVERVFTQPLNDVWRDVFTRLAPSEPFVPAFGAPTTTRGTLNLRLETIHESGDIAGTPLMMLSTGNLNTAALSLFIALHLTVEPQFPCLVFDDPVQSMDEVHITQFAGLLRVLSKQHNRQIVIAVHERELFEYLKLELSPAFENDKLITVELGLDSQGNPFQQSTPFAWTDDKVLAA
ncbi:MAG: AAA family ATPase [Acidimicrobiaceae bacterium]|nr:AAA family ATPase [Acidimicrobiaceae bacterium]